MPQSLFSLQIDKYISQKNESKNILYILGTEGRIFFFSFLYFYFPSIRDVKRVRIKYILFYINVMVTHERRYLISSCV